MGRRIAAQHSPKYRPIPSLLREFRESDGLTQRALGDRLGKPHSWIYNCETGNRRVDLAEYVAWADACGIKPLTAVRRYLGML